LNQNLLKMSKKCSLTRCIWSPVSMSIIMESFYVIVHALLWSFMEVETEGKRGWMYDSQTSCSGILAFTWYHIIMNIIALMTVFFIVSSGVVKTAQFNIIYLYNVLLWFVVEDVGWFMINSMTYRTAPWQTTTASVLSTVIPLFLIYTMKKQKVPRKFMFDWILFPILLYIWVPFPWTKPFDSSEPYNPRHTYCD